MPIIWIFRLYEKEGRGRKRKKGKRKRAYDFAKNKKVYLLNLWTDSSLIL